ncbi:WxcM-like domain-containing protein [Treponema sp. OMZ 789]|nr:WxcM-like domain-containing protein [Treponema sp. OMZ 789]UTC71192.1 WxcM-like domain-containing protein [Treponema sp. OMZ 790]UTC73909.1 WxcM-like domain-containing protein [Treponema sp. OMZ 791]
MELIQLPKIRDERGCLSFFESENHIPFEIKGVNLLNIYDTDEQYEFTDNKNTNFFFVALSGSFLFGNGSSDDFIDGVFLENANKGMYIAKNTDFTLLRFAENTAVLIISSTEEFNVRKI